MRLVVVFLCLLFPLPAMCISLDELIRLAELQTGDELMISIIDKDGVDRAVSAKDVIYLKERGVSEGVIDYLWKQSYQAEEEFLPPQEGESKIIGENLRSYTSIDENGNKVLVLTNLDEQGRRMGPPPPPAPERPQEPEIVYVTQPAPQTYDNVKSNIPAWAEMPYYEPPTFSPAISDYGYGYGYYPFYSVSTIYPGPIFPRHCKTSWGGHNSWGHQMKGNTQRSFWSGSRKR
ncbi:MAG TPA: hypothetical protein VLH08_04365 [Acidobacteriota bacterium]|nr:hypothetical protein [Acidobacteriota bacterium]